MPELSKAPAVPSAILNFFSSQPDFAAVIGDISEEFHQRAERSGAAAAKLWFWREAIRNALALTAREVLRTPGRTILIALGCFLAVNLVTGLYVGVSLYLPQFRNPGEFVRNPGWRDLLLMLNIMAPLAIGWMGSRFLRGREWALALTYTLVTACWAGVALWYATSLNADLPPSLQVIAIWGNIFRQIAFWLGCLWIRRPGSTSTLPAPARNRRA